MLNRMIKELPTWVITLLSMLVPGSGHIVLGRVQRGLIFLFFMGLLGLITFRLTNESISPIGRFAGAFGVWAISVVEVNRLAKTLKRKEVK